jgi:hypothetical protein
MAELISRKSRAKQDIGGDETPRTPIAKKNTAPIEISLAPNLMTLPLSEIREDAEIQPREVVNQTTVQNYADLMREGIQLPPLDVFGDDHLLADGYQRLAAARLSGVETIEVRVHPGGRREAMLFAFGANAKHGLPLSNYDKRRIVLRMLKDEGWSQWSSNRIAKLCGVSHTLVDNLRTELSSLTCKVASETRTFKTKHGTTAAMRTSKIGKSRLKKSTKSKPTATERAADAVQEPAGPLAATNEIPPPDTQADRRTANTVVNGTPKLDSLAWLGATETERQKFVAEVGLAALFAAATPQLVAGYRDQLLGLLGTAS